MEDEFKKLVVSDKNTVDGIIQWLKDCEIIDDAITEEQFRRNLGDADRVDQNTFIEALGAVSQSKNSRAVAEDLMYAATEMDEIFAKIQKTGQNNLELLVRWLTASNVLNDAEDTEVRVRQLLEGADPENVDLAQFKQVVAEIAAGQTHNVAELVQALVDQGPKLFDFVAERFVSDRQK